MQPSGTGVPTAFCPALKGVAVRGTPGRTLLGKQCSLPVASTMARVRGPAVSLARPQPDGVQRPLPAQPRPQPCDGASRVPSAGQRGSPADPCGQPSRAGEFSARSTRLPVGRGSGSKQRVKRILSRGGECWEALRLTQGGRTTKEPREGSSGAGASEVRVGHIVRAFPGGLGRSPGCLLRGQRRLVWKVGPGPCCWTRRGWGDVGGGCDPSSWWPLFPAVTAVCRSWAHTVADLDLDLARMVLGVLACL